MVHAGEHAVKRILQKCLSDDVGILLVLLVDFREIIGIGADFGDDATPVGFAFGLELRGFTGGFVERPRSGGASGADFAAAVLFRFNNAGERGGDLPGRREGEDVDAFNANAECKRFGAVPEFGVHRAA